MVSPADSPRHEPSLSPIEEDRSQSNLKKLEDITEKLYANPKTFSSDKLNKIERTIHTLDQYELLPSIDKIRKSALDAVSKAKIGLDFKSILEKADPSAYYFQSLPIDELDDPYLAYISLTLAYSPKETLISNLNKIPLNIAECFEECKKLDDDLKKRGISPQITPEAISYFIELSQAVNLPCQKEFEYRLGLTSDLNTILEYRKIDSKEYDKAIKEDSVFASNIFVDEPLEETYLKNVKNFCGIDYEKIGDYSVKGGRDFIILKEIANLESFSNKLDFDKQKKYQDAFSLASENPKSEDDFIELSSRIGNGDLTIINSGYCSITGSHLITCVFNDDYFAICNRGAKSKNEKNVEIYQFDRKLINPQIIDLIVRSSFILRKNSSKGLIYQTIFVYNLLPKLLNGIKLDLSENTTPTINFKRQTTGNCSKASPVVAFKAAVFLDNLSNPDAGKIAKNIGKDLSLALRIKAIQRLNKFDDEPAIHFQKIGFSKLEIRGLISKEQIKKKSEKLRNLDLTDHPLLVNIVELSSQGFTPEDIYEQLAAKKFNIFQLTQNIDYTSLDKLEVSQSDIDLYESIKTQAKSTFHHIEPYFDETLERIQSLLIADSSKMSIFELVDRIKDPYFEFLPLTVQTEVYLNYLSCFPNESLIPTSFWNKESIKKVLNKDYRFFEYLPDQLKPKCSILLEQNLKKLFPNENTLHLINASMDLKDNLLKTITFFSNNEKFIREEKFSLTKNLTRTFYELYRILENDQKSISDILSNDTLTSNPQKTASCITLLFKNKIIISGDLNLIPEKVLKELIYHMKEQELDKIYKGYFDEFVISYFKKSPETFDIPFETLDDEFIFNLTKDNLLYFAYIPAERINLDSFKDLIETLKASSENFEAFPALDEQSAKSILKLYEKLIQTPHFKTTNFVSQEEKLKLAVLMRKIRRNEKLM